MTPVIALPNHTTRLINGNGTIRSVLDAVKSALKDRKVLVFILIQKSTFWKPFSSKLFSKKQFVSWLVLPITSLNLLTNCSMLGFQPLPASTSLYLSNNYSFIPVKKISVSCRAFNLVLVFLYLKPFSLDYSPCSCARRFQSIACKQLKLQFIQVYQPRSTNTSWRCLCYVKEIMLAGLDPDTVL